MPKRIYVGNLPGTITDRQVKELFGKFGQVTNVDFSRDGSVAVEMSDGADEAIKALNQTQIDGSRISVLDVPMRR